MSEEPNILLEVTRDEMHTPPQEPNLITFTPSPGHNAVPQQVQDRRSEPKKQRSPRRRKTRSDWQLNQRQFDQN